MSELDITPMYDMYDHCHFTMQTPTQWLVNREAFICLKKAGVIYAPGIDVRPDGSVRVFGVDVEISTDLPYMKFVLKAGENSVGADVLENPYE